MYDLKASAQCEKAASTVMSVLGMIRRNFKKVDVKESGLLNTQQGVYIRRVSLRGILSASL